MKIQLTNTEIALCEAVVGSDLYAGNALGNEHSWHLQVQEKLTLF